MTTTTQAHADACERIRDDKALERLMDDAGGFDRRAPRTSMVNLRFTEPELELLDAIAERDEVQRVEAIRRLLARGLGREAAVNELATAAADVLQRIRASGNVRRIGRDRTQPLEDAMAALRPDLVKEARR